MHRLATQEDRMNILAAMVTGALVAVVARLFLPGRDPGGLTVLVGIAGGAIAGYLGQTFGWYQPGFTRPGMLASMLAALLLVVAYRWMTGRPRRA
jgi:uncharacterized membrane protein YeaQ/YmgE (transglycosylase-associated protein family)